MIKLNDVRVLRNILGDKHEGEEDWKLPRYEPKKLMKVEIPKIPENFGLSKDVWSWDEKLGKRRFTSKVYDSSGTPLPSEKELAELRKRQTQIKGFEKSRAEAADIQLQRLQTEEKQRALEWKASPTGQAYTRRKELLEQQKQVQEAREAGAKLWQAQQQAIEARKTAEADVGKIRFEKSAFGQFVKGPWTKTAARAVENIGQNLGGSIVGPYTDPGASRRLSTALRARAAYFELLKKRHDKKGEKIGGEADIEAFGTATERKRWEELKRGVERAQGTVATTGFMAGTSGQMIIGQARQPRNLQQFTQVGASPQYGTFTPEAFSRLGVSQSLTAIRPETKWDTLLSRGGGAGVGSTDRISRILGKKPDPIGVTSGAFEKLKRFL